jgi:hypothetical protein
MYWSNMACKCVHVCSRQYVCVVTLWLLECTIYVVIGATVAHLFTSTYYNIHTYNQVTNTFDIHRMWDSIIGPSVLKWFLPIISMLQYSPMQHGGSSKFEYPTKRNRCCITLETNT